MNKGIFAILSLTLLVLSSMAVIADTADAVYRSNTGMSRMPSVRAPAGCNLNIMTNPGDVYFTGKARQECVEKNKFNLNCQQACFDQVKMMLRTRSAGRALGLISNYACNDIDPILLKGSAASRCYYNAANECAKANVGNDYCRKKCVRTTYTTCRHNTQTRNMGMAY